MTTSRMRRHTPFGPTDPNLCVWGGVTDVINCKHLKIGSGVSELEDPEKWHFPLKPFIALTTVLRYRADCDTTHTRITVYRQSSVLYQIINYYTFSARYKTYFMYQIRSMSVPLTVSWIGQLDALGHFS